MNLLPQRYCNRDFFVADLFDCTPKDDLHSMEHPLFTLSMQKDIRVRHYEHNGQTLTVTPSAAGMPTIWDKDIVIYVVSQYIAALNRNRADAVNRKVRFSLYDYFVSTNRQTGKSQYDGFKRGLVRLRGMTMATNIETGGEITDDIFGIFDRARLVRRSRTDDRLVACEITLSEWLHRAILALEVLTISQDYFRLRGGLERRLYEIARKYCGHQARFQIGLELLHKKCGAYSSMKEFRRMVRAIAESDVLPDYRLAYSAAKDQALFYIRDIKRLARSVVRPVDSL